MSASTWGNPNATKRIFLIHGMTESSLSWHSIASEFASRGYFVTAPDLLGHGRTRRGSDSSMAIAALADGLRPYFTGGTDHPYDIVVGHSLGCLVASALLPLLKSTRPVRVVLSDPPLDVSPKSLAVLKPIFCDPVINPKSYEVFKQDFSAGKEDAIFAWLGPQVCDIATLDALDDDNRPWSFSHLLLTVPENVNVAVLAADPTNGAMVKEEVLKGYPRVTATTVWGTSHQIPIDAPQAIIETALQGIESRTGDV